METRLINPNSEILNLSKRISLEDDEKAFRKLVDLFSSRLFGFAQSFLKDKLLSEEVVSDVFFKLWVHRKDLAEIENLKAYLFKATYHTSLNYLDANQRKKAISLEDVEVDLGVDTISPETKMIDKELKEIIEKAIESLPDRCKLIYKMAKVEEMKYKEIAELLNISIKTIDNQLSIAIRKIGEVIREYLNANEGSGDYLILLKLFTLEK